MKAFQFLTVLFTFYFNGVSAKFCYNTADVNCDYLARNNFCNDTKYIPFMRANCGEVCGFCNNTLPTMPPLPSVQISNCTDNGQVNCNDLVSRNICHDPGYSSFMRRNCPHSCQLCYRCGIRNAATARVIAGQDAPAGSWPWQAMIYRNSRPNCGGSLIGRQWIITAAHCVYLYDRSPWRFKIYLGEHEFAKFASSKNVYYASKIKIHPSYLESTLDYDFALIKLHRPAIFTNKISPICLPKHNTSPPVGHQCFTTGWGYVQWKRRLGQVLQQVKMPIISQNECNKYNAYRHKSRANVTESMICAGYSGIAKPSVCDGDSGGPLACPKANSGVFELTGVTSWADVKCRSSIMYSVFSKVSIARKWIDSIVKL